MINPFIPRRVNILNNISPNVSRKHGEILKDETIKTTTVIETLDEHPKGKDENSSVSSRSSQSETSDVVKLNYTNGDSAANVGIKSKLSSTLESKSVVALFIGDLEPSVTENMLRDIFGKFRSLTSVKICLDSNSGKSLGYGYLNFANSEDAEKATEEFNYRPIEGQEVRIMPSLRNSFYRKNVGTNVFFSNLPLEDSRLTTRVFYDTFKKYGKILSCKLDKRKDIGFIYFNNDQSARKVIKDYNGKEFFGNKVLCGIHFDKDFRKYPEFEKRISNLDSITVAMEELTTEDSNKVVLQRDSGSQVPHPNAVFVKNLPMDCTNEEILDFFSNIGPVKSVFSSKAPKFNSLWAFVTYKRGSDTSKSIQFYNDKEFKNRRLIVSKAVPKEGKNQSPSNYKNYKTIVQIDDVSPVLNEEFLSQLCIQERIKINKLHITSFNEKTLTYSGFIKCKTKNDATRVFASLNNRLIGGSVIKCSWGKYEPTAAPTNVRIDGPRDFQQAQLLAFPLCHPLYYSMKQSPNQNGFSHLPLPLGKNKCDRKDEEQKAEILHLLRRQVRKGIDFLKYPSATRDENLTCIADYIFDVYWRGDIDSLTKFMLLMNTNTQHEGILQRQIKEAANFLGFGR